MHAFLASQTVPPPHEAAPPVWFEKGTFVESEHSRRQAHNHISKEKAFYSHCWRDADTQPKKRRIIDCLSGPKEVGFPSCSKMHRPS